MNRTRTALPLLALSLLSAPAYASLASISSTTAQNGERGYGSAIIDTSGGFAYFGSSNPVVVGVSTFGYISQIQISPSLACTGASAFFDLFTNLTAAIYDPGTGFSYWASSATPSGLEKLHLNAPISFSSTTFPSGYNAVATAVIDSTNQFGYFGTQTSTSSILKVRLSDLAVISTITLPSSVGFLSASVIDTTNGFAYFGSNTTPGAVAKIRLSDFTLDSILTFSSGEGGVGSAAIDTTNGFAYFGTHDSPGKVIKVGLSAFSHIITLTLKSGENDLTSAVADPTRGFAYFGTNTSSGVVVPIYGNGNTEKTSVTLGSGQNFLRSAVIDTANSYAYFGTYTSTGEVIKMDLLAGLPDILTQPADAIVHAGDNLAFSVLADGRGLSYQWQMNGVTIAGATSAAYSRTALVSDDGALFDCVVTGTNGTTTSSAALVTLIPVVRVFPNPWRADRHASLNITFDGLLPNSTVKIFNLAAHWVRTLPAGTSTWDLTNDAGQTVASGYYFYLVTTGNSKQTSEGKIAIIR